MTKKTEPYKTSILLSYMKVGKETLTFADIEIGKNEFYRHKTPIFWKYVDIEKLLVSNKQNEKTSPFLWIESNRLKATEPL